MIHNIKESFVVALYLVYLLRARHNFTTFLQLLFTCFSNYMHLTNALLRKK